MQATDRFFCSLGQQFGRLGVQTVQLWRPTYQHDPHFKFLPGRTSRHFCRRLEGKLRIIIAHHFYSNDIWPDLEAFMATPVMKMRSMISNNEICFVASNIFYCYFIIKYGNSRFGYGETVFMNIGNNSLYVFTSRKEKRNAYFH